MVAALLPAVLTAGGGALLAFKLKTDNDGWTPDFLIASAAVVLFSLFLVLGVYAALMINDFANADRSRAALEHSMKDRVLYGNRFTSYLFHIRGVLPFLSFASMSAPWSTRNCMTNWGRGAWVAQCSGVRS